MPPGLEGRVQLLCNVSDLLGLSVNTNSCRSVYAVDKRHMVTIQTLFSFMYINVGTITVSWRWGWVADSLGSSPQWGKEGPLSQVSLVGPKAVDKRA